MKAVLPVRTQDPWGDGAYQARRGTRKHNGIDYCCPPKSMVLAQKGGTITKLGYAYKDDVSFRYVEIKDHLDEYARYFYVEPSLQVNDRVMMGGIIGHSQKLGDRYKGITEHVHFECFELVDGKREYFDPETYCFRK